MAFVGLHHVQVAAPLGAEDEARRFYGALVGAHPAFELDSADGLRALAARLVEAGVDVRWSDELPAYERFYANDPWGNRLELLAVAR